MKPSVKHFSTTLSARTSPCDLISPRLVSPHQVNNARGITVYYVARRRADDQRLRSSSLRGLKPRPY